jgi:hypothetical protein
MNKGETGMTAPIQAAIVTKTHSPFAGERWMLTIDADAAEILGERRTVYNFNTMDGAMAFADTLQCVLDASWWGA